MNMIESPTETYCQFPKAHREIPVCWDSSGNALAWEDGPADAICLVCNLPVQREPLESI